MLISEISNESLLEHFSNPIVITEIQREFCKAERFKKHFNENEKYSTDDFTLEDVELSLGENHLLFVGLVDIVCYLKFTNNNIFQISFCFQSSKLGFSEIEKIINKVVPLIKEQILSLYQQYVSFKKAI